VLDVPAGPHTIEAVSDRGDARYSGSLQVHPQTSAVLAYHEVPSAPGTNAFAVQTVQGPRVYD
jgi:hypothetical protein